MLREFGEFDPNEPTDRDGQRAGYEVFDPVASSLEIARRGRFKFIECKFYPKLEVIDQWKKYITSTLSTWKELYEQIKILDIRYRIPLDFSQVGFRIRSRRKGISIYSFI